MKKDGGPVSKPGGRRRTANGAPLRPPSAPRLLFSGPSGSMMGGGGFVSDCPEGPVGSQSKPIRLHLERGGRPDEWPLLSSPSRIYSSVPPGSPATTVKPMPIQTDEELELLHCKKFRILPSIFV